MPSLDNVRLHAQRNKECHLLADHVPIETGGCHADNREWIPIQLNVLCR